MRFSRLPKWPKAALAAAIGLVLLPGCGSKGPLYLRDNPPAGIKLPKPPAPKPVPYPAEPPGAQEKQD